MYAAVSHLRSDLIESGMTSYDVATVLKSYKNALRTPSDAAWRQFYEDVVTALLRMSDKRPRRDESSRRATASLLRLIEDDFGSELVSPDLAGRLRSLLIEPEQPANPLRIRGATALVTRASRGIGAVFVEALVAEGARKVYACARDSATLADPWSEIMSSQAVVPLEVDTTDPTSVRRAADAAGDVTLLINNVGAQANIRSVLEMPRAFAPILGSNAPAAILNVLPGRSLLRSDSAALSATSAIRTEFAPRGIHVVDVIRGLIDSYGAAAPPRNVPAGEVVAIAFGAIESQEDIVVARSPRCHAELVEGSENIAAAEPRQHHAN